MNKEKPTKEELEAIILEKIETTKELLQREGFKQRVPRADWYISNSSLLIIKENETREIPDSRLKKILDGEESIPEEDMRLIQEWYAISSYRYGHELEKYKNSCIDAVKKKDYARSDECKKRMKELVEEKRSISQEEFTKRELAYYYQETGERLDRLYEILYAEIETIKARFGSVELKITRNCYDKKIEEQEYFESKGFFDDIKIALGVAKSLHAPPEYSSKTGALYSYEWIGGKGMGIINVGEKPIGLTAKIEKDGLKNILRFSVQTRIDSSKEKLTEKVSTLLPELKIEKEPLWYAEKEGFRAGYLEKEGTLMFAGDLDNLEEEIKRFLKAIAD